LVWSHPEFRAFARENFVCLADDDVFYSHHPEKGKDEYKLMSRIFAGTNTGIHQGIYVATPSGRLLAQANVGWPDPDPVGGLAELKKGLARYRSLSREERLAGADIPPAQRLTRPRERLQLPEGTLRLRTTKRGYAYPGMSTFDERHPVFLGLDRLWFKPSEWQGWIPRELRVGAETEVTGPLRDRIVLLCHQHKAHMAWWPEHIREGRMTSRITGIKGSLISLRIEASYRMKADSEWNTGSYEGSLLAKAEFDAASKRWLKFEGAMLGTVVAGRRLENIHKGELSQRVASAFNLEEGAPDTLPMGWPDYYGPDWASRP
jgi:hypothetical protein